MLQRVDMNVFAKGQNVDRIKYGLCDKSVIILKCLQNMFVGQFKDMTWVLPRKQPMTLLERWPTLVVDKVGMQKYII